MKNILSIAAAIVALFMVTPAFAQETNAISGPSAEINGKTINCNNVKIADFNSTELSYIQSLCNTSTTEKVTPEKVREWASLGKEFSTAVIDTAAGLGMAANEFLFTPVGILIAFYFLWDMIGGIIVGTTFIIFVWFLYFNICSKYEKTTVEYTHVPVLWGMFNVKRIAKVDSFDPAGNAMTRIILAGLAILITFIITAILIF